MGFKHALNQNFLSNNDIATTFTVGICLEKYKKAKLSVSKSG